ncbi:hypothetical protein [Desulfuromonas acetoxidans]|uniref:hypothetical protein n=1 Tax=Desulfuromonas acetoxidans TaxID=891 RepID=UPI0002D6F5A3|nr:hypothetical protein [Desulfuromonas acetoxidans]MBF0646102.1 hypothetical protein [Desulfuromonas acetoxidans]NVD25178.1 hypothetical protein [Desulfuromonas acetoxidans]NVE17200.1 hypothetical protein [Desulfuromonas acetoxidans]
MASTSSFEQFNPLCEKCVRSCRQPLGTKLVECPRFSPRPFKLTPPPRKQLDLF